MRPSAAPDQPLIAFQHSLIGPTQIPLMSPSQEVQVRSPLDGPADGDSVVLLKQGDWAVAYTIGSDLQPRPLTPGQLLSAVQCDPEERAAPLPSDTNERVQAAYEAARQTSQLRIGRARRPSGDTKVRRYIGRQRRQRVRMQPPTLRRSSASTCCYRSSSITCDGRDHGPERGTAGGFHGRGPGAQVGNDMRGYWLNPLESAAAPASSGEVMRVICSEGLL